MEHLIITDQAVSFLKEAKKWAFFLSVLGFLGAGFMVLAGIIISILFSVIDVFGNIPDKPDFPFGLIGLLYIALAAVYFFPAYYLYKFAKETGEAFLKHDENLLASAFMFLKKHFKFIGIMIIVLIAFYFVMVIVLIIVGVNAFTAGGGNSLFV